MRKNYLSQDDQARKRFRTESSQQFTNQRMSQLNYIPQSDMHYTSPNYDQHWLNDRNLNYSHPVNDNSHLEWMNHSNYTTESSYEPR
jgi:hypothetical protein